MALPYEFGSPEFHEAVRKATHDAYLENLRAGLPVTYLDDDGLNVLELPDGRRFEIRWTGSTLPNGKNYEIIRQLDTRAA